MYRQRANQAGIDPAVARAVGDEDEEGEDEEGGDEEEEDEEEEDEVEEDEVEDAS